MARQGAAWLGAVWRSWLGEGRRVEAAQGGQANFPLTQPPTAGFGPPF